MIKDSGDRTDFGTGSVRDLQKGKGRYDLQPIIALRALAKHYEGGAEKYGDHNWRKGQPLCKSFINSAKRHLDKWLLHWEDENHLIACAWNILSTYETLEMIKRGKLPQKLDDRLEWYKDDYQFVEGVAEEAPSQDEIQQLDSQVPIRVICNKCRYSYLVVNGKSYFNDSFDAWMSTADQCPNCDELAIKF
jgi:hypothetical protein